MKTFNRMNDNGETKERERERETEITNHVVANSNKPIKNDYRRSRFSTEILKTLFRLFFLLHILKLFCIQCNWDFACMPQQQ